MNGGWIALLALVPLATGPLPEERTTLTAALCAGGEIVIPLGDREDEPRGDCHQKACHAGGCREKHKRTN